MLTLEVVSAMSLYICQDLCPHWATCLSSVKSQTEVGASALTVMLILEVVFTISLYICWDLHPH